MVEIKWGKHGEKYVNEAGALLLTTELYEDVINKIGDDYRKYELKFSLQKRNLNMPGDNWIKSELKIEFDKERFKYIVKKDPNAISSIERTIGFLDIEDEYKSLFRYNIEVVIYV